MLSSENTQNSLKKMLVLIASTLIIILISGCDLSLMGFRDTTKGALNIAVDSTRFASSRSVLPSADMTPAEYRISGVGPSSATFEQISTGTSANIYDLAIGNWTITVLVYNASDEQIGWGESVVMVTASNLSDASVLVEPYSGTGAVSFSVAWDDSDVTSPAISAILTDTAGNTSELPFTLSAGTASYADTEISSGYYTLNIQLLDGGTVVSGMVEAVRVLQDFQTTGNFNFTDLNNPSGDISISVTVNMSDPFEPVINGAAATIAHGSDMSASASVPDSDGETLVYSWFVNGNLVGSSETATFGSTLRRGYYRLDLVVTNAEGSRSGSAAHYFTVE